jgi:peptidoglycan/xylan/chitin deacetylase (PgdA/CDA1 family)
VNRFTHQLVTSPQLHRLMAGCLGSHATIFTLHRTNPANGAFEGAEPALLETCLQWAQRQGFDFISLDDLVAQGLAGKPLAKPSLCFTLDDGYADQTDSLIPLLLRYQAKPTLFVIAQLLDGVDWPWDNKIAHLLWNSSQQQVQLNLAGTDWTLDLSSRDARKATRRRLTRFAKGLQQPQITTLLQQLEAGLGLSLPASPPEQYQPAHWARLRELEQQGLRIGSHACSHFTFSSLTPDQIRSELQDAQARLSQELRNPSKVFCYPSGTAADFSPSHCPLVQAAGYSGAVTTLSKPLTPASIQAAPFGIPRIGMPKDLATFQRYASWLEYLRSKFS